jgi:hypothetical protein
VLAVHCTEIFIKLPFDPFDWIRNSPSTMGLTTLSSHLLRAVLRLNKLTRFLRSGVILDAPVILGLERPRWRAIGSNRALPSRNMGAGVEVSVVGNNDANEEKLRGSEEDAGPYVHVFCVGVDAEGG